MSENETIEKRLRRLSDPTRIAAEYMRKILYDPEKCGPCKITTVFGSYPNDGIEKIDEVCKLIASDGFCAITLHGYYSPSDPNNMQSIDDLIPSVVRVIFQQLQSMYIRILPRIACRVVVNVTDIRTNLVEWDYSFIIGKPIFTFILAEILSLGEDQDCAYLHKDPSDTWVECIAYSSEFCRVARVHGRFCPFGDLPWIIKQGTMDNRPRYFLIGAKNIEGLKIPLHVFQSLPLE